MLVPKYGFEETLELKYHEVFIYSVQKYEGFGHDFYNYCYAKLFLAHDMVSLIALIGVDVARSSKKDVSGNCYYLKFEKT